MFASQAVFSQTISEINEMRSIQTEINQINPNIEKASKNANEIQSILSGMFLFYKTFISSQDAGSCMFSTSCSEYALETIKKKGILVGPLDFLDRYSRCHGIGRPAYPIDPKTKLFYDPVE